MGICISFAFNSYSTLCEDDILLLNNVVDNMFNDKIVVTIEIRITINFRLSQTLININIIMDKLYHWGIILRNKNYKRSPNISINISRMSCVLPAQPP